MSGMSDIEVFSHPKNILGESPRWHSIDQCLYWTDIEAGAIYRQAGSAEKPDVFTLGVKVGCIGFRESGGFILATGDGFQTWNIKDTRPVKLANPEAGKPNARFNDGLVDPGGRFWAGSMTEKDSSSCLYRLDPDHVIHTMVNNITISNGIGWNKESNRLYFTDSLKRTIWLFDYDLKSGSIWNPRIFVEPTGTGVPDGLVIDTDGNVWSVQCGSGKIMVFNTAGNLIQELFFPTRCITACTFGGSDLSDLYVTSSISLLNPSELPEQSKAGAVFRIKTQSQGVPLFMYAG